MHINRFSTLFLISFFVVVASCHSRKKATKGNSGETVKSKKNTEAKSSVLEGQPGEIVKPPRSVADKYAELMEVSKSDIKNGRLYEFIDQWMGIPYKFGGLAKDGIDCSGLTFLLEQQVY